MKIFFSKRKLPQLANFYHVYDQVQNTLKALFYYHFVNYGLYQTEKKKTKEGGSQKSSFRFLSDFNFFYINKKWFLFVCWFGFFCVFGFFLPSLFVEYNGLFYRWSNVNEIIKLVITVIFAVYMYQRITWVQQILNNVIVVFKKYMIVYF